MRYLNEKRGSEDERRYRSGGGCRRAEGLGEFSNVIDELGTRDTAIRLAIGNILERQAGILRLLGQSLELFSLLVRPRRGCGGSTGGSSTGSRVFF